MECESSEDKYRERKLRFRVVNAISLAGVTRRHFSIVRVIEVSTRFPLEFSKALTNSQHYSLSGSKFY